MRGSTLESDVCRRQILTSNVDPRAVRVNGGGEKGVMWYVVHAKQYRLFKKNPSVLLPCDTRGCIVIVLNGSF